MTNNNHRNFEMIMNNFHNSNLLNIASTSASWVFKFRETYQVRQDVEGQMVNFEVIVFP